MKFGLERISRLLDALGNPHHQFLTIHVAGTNGKGSTASMLAAICTAAGYRTGLYTSPHLVSFTERIRINGKEISRREVAEITNRLRQLIRKHQPTFFDATTAIAFSFFAAKKVDIAIIEVGLGGRLDSTNVIRPLASVITKVGLEHTEVLGDSIEKIAWEKAGIIKKGTPCITGVKQPKALTVLKRVCRERKAPLVMSHGFTVSVRSETLRKSIVDIKAGRTCYDNLRISLPGRFQIENAAIVLTAVDELNKTSRIHLSERSIRAGLGNIQELTGLQGRLSLIHQKPPVIADVAHNPDGMVNLASALQRMGLDELVVVFGVMKDKDHLPMARAVESIAREVIAVAAHSERSRSAIDVAAAFTGRRLKVSAALSVGEGVQLAIQRGSRQRPVLVTGSHYVVSEALEYVRKKKSLTIKG